MPKRRILVVDDEPSIRRTLRDILEYEGYHIEEAVDGEEALSQVSKGEFDLVILDVKMPKIDGMDVLRELHSSNPSLPIVMISGHGTIETAVEATRAGAYDFVEKPPDLNRLLLTVRNALDRAVLVTENKKMKKTIARQSKLQPILGTSSAIKGITSTIDMVAPTEARVLITGEAGTGKELVAKWIHEKSPRRDGPIIEVNCAAIPSELIESELFGHEKGSFTGATKQRIGKFEQANGGTLFLDEIGDMSTSAQAKVLRALQENKIDRVGGDKSISVDVRVLSATNKDLSDQIDAQLFRRDLYDRLSVILIHVPPLRDRREDINEMVEKFATRLSERNGLPEKAFSNSSLQRLRSMDWPGNVRELNNVVERLLILSQGDRVTESEVQRFVLAGVSNVNPVLDLLDSADSFSDFRDMAEKMFIQKKLDQFDWNISKTAEEIGIQRSHLYNKMSKYGIERDSVDH